MITEDRKLPELLAPVGGWQQLRAAVQNGADAVYMGGSRFNARIKAENFTDAQIQKAIDYAHCRNVKVYITMNTLLKDEELFPAVSYVNDLYGMGADAVILQDMGLARLVRNYLPDLPMHLSTQGSVYNKEAVGLIKELGFCRVVPARELTLEEIRAFTEECHRGEDPCQVEVFVHGALCMCYSGQCQMSRILGGVNGRSGNRGLCAQPCRLPYEDEGGSQAYLLSPKDICTLEHIPQLCQAGIDSFKIEGRLKSPQYVAIVTAVYRKYLDRFREEGHVKVQASDLQRLAQIFNRGGFSTGYLFGNPGRALLSGDSPKNQGIYVGTVTSVKKGSPLVDVQVAEKHSPVDGNGRPLQERDICLGDGVEIRGRGTADNVVTYRRELANGDLRIGDMKGRVYPGDGVYKVTDKRLLQEAEASYGDDFARKLPVALRFEIKEDGMPRLTMREGDITVQAEGSRPAEKAVRRPLDAERVKLQLAKLGNTVFEASDVSVRIREGMALPISEINRMRREAAEKLLQEKCRTERTALSAEALRELKAREKLGDASAKMVAAKMPRLFHVYGKEDLENLPDAKGMQVCVPLELYMRDDAMQRFLPYILNISKGRLDKYIGENFQAICEKVRDKGILIGNPGWLKQFREAGIKVYGDYGLNAYNQQCLQAYEEMGIELLAWSHETENATLENIPLMITEHPIHAGKITDRKGKAYRILQAESGDKYLIFQ